MDSFTPGAPSTMLEAINYVTPVVLTVAFVSIQLFHLWTLQRDKSLNTASWRLFFSRLLSFTVATSYLASALAFIPCIATTPDHALIHAWSQTLLWIALFLCLISTDSPVALAYIVVALINLALEIIIWVLTTIDTSQITPARWLTQVTLKLVSCIALAAFVAAIFLLLVHTHCEDGADEARPLLENGSIKSWGSSYNTAQAPRFDRHGTSDADADADDSDDNDDEEELRANQRKRLRDDGGFVGYIRGFKVFLPYVIPRGNFRLQSYTIMLFVNTLLMRALNVLHPWQLGIIVDKLATGTVFPWLDICLWTLYRAAASNNCGLGALNEWFENRLKAWSQQQLSVAALDHVMRLSMSFHDQKDSGEVIKAVEQAGSLSTLLHTLVMEIIPGLMDILIALWYITFLFDMYAVLILIAVAIAYVFVSYHMTLIATVARRIATRKERTESTVIFESISNWFTVSYFNRREYAMQRLSHAVDDSTKAGLWNDDLYTYIFALQDSVEYIGRLGIMLLAAHRIVQGTSTLGSFVTLHSYWDMMTFPLWLLSISYRNLNSRLVDAERLLQLFQNQPTVKDRPEALDVEVVKGEVAFENVEFAYEGRETTLRNLSCTAKPGQMIALVGETGSGKSTTLKLLMRFYDVSAGRITIDGIDIRDMTLDSLRNCFGLVPQDTVLFNMSILENVRYGRLDATDEEVFAACRAASLHDKILSFPSGYASKVGERGVKLSGGERQRVAIARVFLRNSRIVLLDEATSAMDSNTEGKIQDALRRLIRGRTTFIIAHRLSTVVEADHILVIDNGQIVESGTHQTLLAQSGRYLQLWSKQAALATKTETSFS